MAQIIEINDFKGIYNVTQNTIDIEDLNAIIKNTQDEVLNNILGAHEFNLFDTWLEITPENAKYEALKDGAIFTVDYDGVTYNIKYTGLKPILLGITYFNILKWQQSFNTGSGEKTLLSSAGKSNSVGSISKAINGWNKSVELIGKDLDHLYLGNYIGKPVMPRFYDPNMVLKVKEYQEDSVKNTVYNYLKANESDFPKWIFTEIDKVNELF